MKIASNIIVAAALVLASAPAFAHGGGMGGNLGGNMGGHFSGSTGGNTGGNGSMGGTGVGHNGMTVTTQTHNGHVNVTKTMIQREVWQIDRVLKRLNMEIIKLQNTGRGNSKFAMNLAQQVSRLLKDKARLECC